MEVILSLLLLAQQYPPQCKGDLRQRTIIMSRDYVCPFGGVIYTHDADKCRTAKLNWYFTKWKEDTQIERLKCKAEKQLRQQILETSINCANERTLYKYKYRESNRWYRSTWFIVTVSVVGSLVTGLTVYAVMK